MDIDRQTDTHIKDTHDMMLNRKKNKESMLTKQWEKENQKDWKNIHDNGDCFSLPGRITGN